MVGRVATINVVVQYLRFEHFYIRWCEHIINLIALAASPKSMAGPNIFDVGMQHAKSIDHWNRIVRFASIQPAE